MAKISAFNCIIIGWDARESCCNIGSETHLYLKSREISFSHNILFCCPISLKFCKDRVKRIQNLLARIMCNNFDKRDGVSNHRRLHCYPTVCSGADQRKYQSSASLAFVRGIHRSPVKSSHKGPVTRKMFPFDDVTMYFHKRLSRCVSYKQARIYANPPVPLRILVI